jgi:hypothetical protein
MVSAGTPELGHDGPQVAVGEAAGKEPEDAQRREQGMGARVTEADGRDGGPGLGGEGLADLGDRGLAVGGVVADHLDVEETPAGCEAGCPQGGQVVQPFADGEVAGVVDRGFRSERLPFLVVLLDLRVLVIDVQGGNDPRGEDPGAEPARRGAGSLADDPAAEDQPDVIGPADTEVVADDFLEEDPPGDGLAQGLGQGEFRLQHRGLVPVAGRGVLGGVRGAAGARSTWWPGPR